MSNSALTAIAQTKELSLYTAAQLNKSAESEHTVSLVASTPETRSICNDPFILGVEYTTKLRHACARILASLRKNHLSQMKESQAVVLHILRGGLNFGLRDACAEAFGWNAHSSAFISAQRVRDSNSPSEWIITESDYKKVHLPPTCSLVFGDVVATGTSLQFALEEIAAVSEQQNSRIEHIVFFTIGGQRSTEIIKNLFRSHADVLQHCKKAIVVYLEGVFTVPDVSSLLSIRLDGTDLLRGSGALLAPEFLESQYESPTYPLERCAIYDAGSRAFEIREYLEDVADYWNKVLFHATSKRVNFKQYVAERMSTVDVVRFAAVELSTLCERQIEKVHKILGETA